MKFKKSIKCPFCGVNYSSSDNNVSWMLIHTTNNGLNNYMARDININVHGLTGEINRHNDSIIMFMCVCPNCNKTYSFVKKVGKQYTHDPSKYVNISPLFPISKISKYSKYVPKYIFEDYKESYAILNYSPQSSATLSRRILEEIIENYFNITEGTLFNKINKLSKTNKLNKETIDTLHAFRKIGNIGAHMQESSNKIIRIDNPGEAKILLKMIELLFNKTYVEHFNNELTENEVKSLKNKYYNNN